MGVYKSFLRPILFRINPEKVHNDFIKIGSFLGKFYISKKLTKVLFSYENPRLFQEIEGIKFKNPIGLAAGFDKNAELLDIIGSVGFGFTEVGSITGNKCNGNPKPRLWRLPLDSALAVNYGLVNEGAKEISKKFKGKKLEVITGINIAKTNNENTKGNDPITDYLKSYSLLKSYGDYLTINLSCPNTKEGHFFQKPPILNKLLKKLGKMQKPVFLKISPDLTKDNLDQIILLCFKYNITGLIISNLKHDHNTLKTPKKILKLTKGGISGIPTKEMSNDLISYVYKKSKGKLIIIGVGGIFSAQDAYEKLKNGASLVQLITGMIYEGPTLIKKINKGLIKLLNKDKFNSISQAIGTNHIM